MDKNLTELMEKKLNNGRQYRSLKLEARAGEDESYIVEGYATTFNEPYTLWSFDNYEVREQIDKNAFAECDMSDVIMQYDHEGRVFARLRNNTLELKIDDHGLFVRADLGGTEEGRKLYEEIKGGYTDRMSFAFTVSEEERTTTENHDDGSIVITRTITKIGKLYDVSAVSIPANDATEISARAFGEGVIAEAEAERLKVQEEERKKKILKLKLRMEEI